MGRTQRIVFIRIAIDIVHTDDIHLIRYLNVRGSSIRCVSFAELVLAHRARTGIVDFLRPIIQLLRGLGTSCIVRGINFIAQGPHDDGGEVLSTVDHGLQVKLRPGLAGRCRRVRRFHFKEADAIVVTLLSKEPGVKCFLNDHQAQLVANLQQLVGRRVVGDADSIDAHPLEDFHLSLDGTVIRHSAQCALVVVHTHAVELHPLAVEEEAVVDGKLRPTESKAALITVGNNAVHQNLCHQVVEVRVVHGP